MNAKQKHKSEALKAAWKRRTKSWRKNFSKKMRIKASKQMAQQWADPIWRAKMIETRKKQAQRPEQIKKNRERTKNLWKDKKYRAKQLRSRKNSYAYQVGRREKLSLAMIGKHSWNHNQTKETHPTLEKFSKRLIGTVPQWSKYFSWYQNKKKRIKMRSSWEVAFAKWCDKKRIPWEYEPRWFNVGSGPWRGVSYTPDFYLPKEKQWIEIKGHLTKANAKKIAAFKKKYHKLNWVMYRHKELKAMGVLKR